MGKPKEAVADAAAGGSFRARVLERLGGVMRARGLRLVKCRPQGCALLVRKGCWVRLQLHGDGEVSCAVIDSRTGAEYELVLYLFLVLRDGVVRFLPAYRECGCGNVADAHLEAIAAALGDRVMDGPLSGEFGWGRDYWVLHEEAFAVGEGLLPVIRQGGMGELRAMLAAGDLRWIVEGRNALEIRDAVDER